jgi:hypothetical protein
VEYILSTPEAAAKLNLELYVRILFSFVNFLENINFDED